MREGRKMVCEYEEPIERLWFNNFLKTKKLEREIEVLEEATVCLQEDGEGFKAHWWFNTYEVKSPFGMFVIELPVHNADDYSTILRNQRYLELRRLELDNHKRNLRRYMMERDSEIAQAYNKRKKEGKKFFLNRILTNPLNHHSTNTMEENYKEPLFGNLHDVKQNLRVKAKFCQEVLKDPNNLSWWVNCIVDPPNDILDAHFDSSLLKKCFVDPLLKEIKKEKDYQKMVLERASMMEKNLTPQPRKP